MREAAEDTVVGVCTRTSSTTTGSQTVLAELRQATDTRAKNSWIRILAALGDASALPSLVGCLKDPDETVVIHTIEQLSRWPDPTPVEDLYVVVQKGANPVQRRRALDTIIRLAATAAEDQQRPAEMLVKWFKQANQAAQTPQERRLIISGLGRVNHIESLQLLVPCLDNADLQNEAALAILQIAPGLRQDSQI
jgi:HEAT repeat protein